MAKSFVNLHRLPPPPPYSTMPKNMHLYRTFVSVGTVQVVYVTVASFLLLYMYKRSQGTRGGAT